MSRILARAVLHPQLSQSLAILATTVGRDKAYRLIQYLSRLIAWSLLRRGAVEAADRWDALMKGLANGRRIMRLFRPAEFAQAAMKVAGRPIKSLSTPGQVAHVAQIGKQIGMAGYYYFDMLYWLGSIRFLRYDKTQIARMQTLAMRFWLSGITLSLVSGGASLVKLRADSRRFALSNEVSRRDASKSEKTPEDRVREEEERREKGRGLLAQRQTLLSQLIMDSCDIWLPANSLGYTHLNDGAVGALGAFTSYMALQVQWQKHAAVGSRKSQ